MEYKIIKHSSHPYLEVSLTDYGLITNSILNKGMAFTDHERDLFNLANNFGIRHHNDHQKTSYDANIWLSWMFYFYLATIHVVLRKQQQASDET